MRKQKTSNGLPEAATGLRGQLGAKSRGRREVLARLPTLAGALRNDLLPPLELVHVLVASVLPPQRMVRTLDVPHVQEVARSISVLGFTSPILVDHDNRLIDGVARWKAARLLGLESIPCVRVGHLTKTELRVLRLALNRLGEKGIWNIAELRIELGELVLGDAPLEIVGFSTDELDHILLDPEVTAGKPQGSMTTTRKCR